MSASDAADHDVGSRRHALRSSADGDCKSVNGHRCVAATAIAALLSCR